MWACKNYDGDVMSDIVAQACLCVCARLSYVAGALVFLCVFVQLCLCERLFVAVLGCFVFAHECMRECVCRCIQTHT